MNYNLTHGLKTDVYILFERNNSPNYSNIWWTSFQQ